MNPLLPDRQFIEKIKDNLLTKQKEIESQIQSINPESLNNALPETTEIGFSSWHMDLMTTLSATKHNLLSMADNIRHSLIKIKNGTYGLCDSCGNHISLARLEAMPTATLCLVCLAKII